MTSTPLAIADVLLLEPRLFEDQCGWFYESFNAASFAAASGRDIDFVQDNHSRSAAGVVRGLHYQLPPSAQGKLVRVVDGRIFDVAVDIRRASPTFGRWVSAELSASNRRQLWIPEGFAHGFMSLEPGSEVVYKTSGFYDRAAERSILWNDPAIGIDWPAAAAPLLSEKDAAAPLLAAAETFP